MDEKIEGLVDTFANRLKKAMQIRNIKAIELSEKTGISKSSLSEYINGKYEAKQNGIYLLAKVLNVSEAWLMGLDVPMEKEKIDFSTLPEEQKRIAEGTYNVMHTASILDKIKDLKQVFPLLGTVKAGYDYLANENIIGYIAIDKSLPDPENYFALKITGESMQPILYENDIIVVHRQSDVESGQIGIVLVDDEEATVKKIIKHDDYIELVAFNSYYPPRRLSKKDKFKIIGKVTEARISKIFE